MSEQITTAAELDALPAECVLVSTRPSYGPTYVMTYDCGDGEVTFAIVGEGSGYYTRDEVIDDLGPLDVVYAPHLLAEAEARGARKALAPVLALADKWAATGEPATRERQAALHGAARRLCAVARAEQAGGDRG